MQITVYGYCDYKQKKVNDLLRMNSTQTLFLSVKVCLRIEQRRFPVTIFFLWCGFCYSMKDVTRIVCVAQTSVIIRAYHLLY